MQYRKRPGLFQDVGKTDRIEKIFAAVVNAADPVHHDDLVAHQSTEPGIEVLILGKPAMPAKIELVSFVSHGTTQAADIVVPFQYGHFCAIDAQFMARGQPGRSSAQYHHMTRVFHRSEEHTSELQ